jgi:hypothetical protein
MKAINAAAAPVNSRWSQKFLASLQTWPAQAASTPIRWLAQTNGNGCRS